MAKQLVKPNQSLTRAVSGLSYQKGKLVPSQTFIDAYKAAMELQDELNRFFGAIKTEMEVHNVKEITGDYGYLKLSPQRRLYADDTVKPRFLTTTVDTAEVRHYQSKHQGKLPAGVTEKVSNRLLKKVKE